MKKDQKQSLFLMPLMGDSISHDCINEEKSRHIKVFVYISIIFGTILLFLQTDSVTYFPEQRRDIC